MKNDFFPAENGVEPIIYAYSDSHYPGLLKVGYTTQSIEQRMGQHYPTLLPHGDRPWTVELRESAVRDDGSVFWDHSVHSVLKEMGVPNENGEWFRCSVDDVRNAILSVRHRHRFQRRRTMDFRMRPEQEEAVRKTLAYYRADKEEDGSRVPKFLWNAKMRFGKTFTAYQLARRMNAKRILVLTFKPAVQSAWKEDLCTHIDFADWQFICRPESVVEPSMDEQYNEADKDKPIVCFGSFLDFLGVDRETGNIKAQNEWVHVIHWDLVIFDEYHFGAWKEKAKALFEAEDEEKEIDADLDSVVHGNEYDESFLPITTSHYLFLSGTPFRALNTGEFIEEQIFNWTYSMEQQAKLSWKGSTPNPYEALPRMVMMAYRLPDSMAQIAMQGEFNEFDLNVFFEATGQGDDAVFKHERYVQLWLDWLRGAYMYRNPEELKLGSGAAPKPYTDSRLRHILRHTLWFLPNVASCDAMANLLRKQPTFYSDYIVNNCSGAKASIGAAALAPVIESMGNPDPLHCQTITLSCGKLVTGVTVKPWSGIFMLRNLTSPETYFQAAFRVQSPWTVPMDDGSTSILKKECYVFDFALDRALKQIADYSCQLDVEESNPEKKVEDFINFLPVLACEDNAMREIDAAAILDIAMSGTSSTLLAKRWESALLVNVDNDTLLRLKNNPEAMDALMKIEGFRNLNQDITTIINKSDKVKKAKKENIKSSPKEKKELDEDQKEFKALRKQIQEKLIKFATRIPIFMYLTDYREHSLSDIIRQLEPNLFKRVTGLDIHDFDKLVSLNVFNRALMNDAVYKFKRYEDSSLVYTGINKHAPETEVGLYDTSILKEDYDRM